MAMCPSLTEEQKNFDSLFTFCVPSPTFLPAHLHSVPNNH